MLTLTGIPRNLPPTAEKKSPSIQTVSFIAKPATKTSLKVKKEVS